MNRPITLIALIAMLLAIPPAGLNAADSRRPNFLFILVDDQSPFDLKVYNPDSALETPNIDRLAREGMVFDAANKLFRVRHDATRRGGTPETGSAWHGDRVMDYLRQRQAAKDTDPFLIYFGFSHPHDERDGTPELLARYGAVNHTDRDRPPPANPRAPVLPANY